MDGSKIRAVLAKNIRDARNKLNYSQADLAERVKISTSFLGEIEICRKFPSPENIERIAAALGMSPAQLFTDSFASSEEYNSDNQFLKLQDELLKTIDSNVKELVLKYMSEEPYPREK